MYTDVSRSPSRLPGVMPVPATEKVFEVFCLAVTMQVPTPPLPKWIFWNTNNIGQPVLHSPPIHTYRFT